ncbi:UPF0696 protein C11orf68 homolog [Acanthaster planci]|uniref:UPF0696 protein C11orf68 homolog n=1 Tax=Acanthaster planci TaxID=133434 RepID=A0A8B7ZYQ9_ACAPL|nr:UPF0696 protein C11orf68 homolog [Acanthaster planci]XP_022110659.1 UPF0696 protein C11orf68 homolog [Acanthaster planci]
MANSNEEDILPLEPVYTDSSPFVNLLQHVQPSTDPADQPQPTKKKTGAPQPWVSEQLVNGFAEARSVAATGSWVDGDFGECISRVEKLLAGQTPPPWVNDSPHESKHSLSLQLRPADEQASRYPGQQLTATELAAQANVTNKAGWLIFDPNPKQEVSLKHAAEEFLAMYPPSRVREVKGSPIHWISARAPIVRNYTFRLCDDGKIKYQGRDIDGLCEAFEDLVQSGRPVTFEKIKQIAVDNRCLVGKWLLYKKTGVHADLTWERIFQATITGHLGISAKVSSAPTVGDFNGPRHVVCVYSQDFTDKVDVMELEARLRKLGIRCQLTYKPDAFSYMGLYRGNEWGLKPTIYTSEFEVRQNRSIITSTYE